MSVCRILANSVVRRVAALLVAVVFAWLGFSGTARAQSMCDFNSPCDEGTAYSLCMADSASNPNNNPRITPGTCTRGQVSDVLFFYQCRRNVDGFPVGACSRDRYYFLASKSCSSLPSLTSEFYPKSGSISCLGGCSFTWYRNADGTSTAYPNGSVCTGDQMPESCVPGEEFWNPILNVCEPMTPGCPAGQTVNSLGQCAPEPCPAGMVLGPDGTCRKRENECPAGQVRGPDGSCVDNECPAGQVRGPDGTCKRDDDGDGNEDDADEEFFSGGDDCSAPPQCSGSPILCGQARIQWRIDCNTRKNRSISGGTCGSPPVCVGEKCDALEYSMLVQQWKAACALEKIAAGGGSGGGAGDNSDLIEFLGGPGTHDPNVAGGDTLTDAGPGDDEFDIPEPDSSGYGYSRTCPTPPSVTLPNGVVVNFDLAPLCQWVSLAGSLVLILAGLVSLRIVSGGIA